MRYSLKLLKPPRAASAATPRRFSADPDPSLPSPDLPCPISDTLSLLQTTDPSTWPTNPNLTAFISSLSPPSILKITRQLPDYQNARQFFDYLKNTPNVSDSIPLAFQAVLELAMRENSESADKLYELFMLAKDQNIPLSVNSGTLLVKCFSREGMLEKMVSVFDAIDEELKNTDVLNLVVSGLLKWGRVDDAFKVLDEMLQKDTCYPPNSNTVAIAFWAILRRNWSGRSVKDKEIYDLVLRFGECGGVLPDGVLLTQIIMRFCRHGEFDLAWHVLHEGMNLGCDVEVASCNALLTRLAQNHDFVRMNVLMKEMKEKGVELNVVTYGIVIKHLCKIRRLDEALELFEKMRDRELGVKPDVVIYNTLIVGLCKVGRQDEGVKLMEEMRLVSKCQPNTITYNCLIDGFCKTSEIDKGYELFEQMSIEGVELNVVTLNTLVDGMCKHGRVSSAMEFFGRMREKGLKGNAITYTVLITAFCGANNIDKAMKLFDEMHENGCSPDAVVYYNLISGLTQAGRMNDATSILSKMKKAGLCLDIIGYNIMIGGYFRNNKFDKASKMLREMGTAGLKYDRVTYKKLFDLCSSESFQYARRKKMTEEGLTPAIVTFVALIQGYCSSDNLDEAMKIFRDMKSSSKVPPNIVIYNALINAHCKKGDVEGALSLMNDMKERGVRPNTTTYNALFKGLERRGIGVYGSNDGTSV